MAWRPSNIIKEEKEKKRESSTNEGAHWATDDELSRFDPQFDVRDREERSDLSPQASPGRATISLGELHTRELDDLKKLEL